jgi:hypothetical protein
MRERTGVNRKFENLIKFPELGGRWTNTREGGLNVYAVILQPERLENYYAKCLTGTPGWTDFEGVISPKKYKEISDCMFSEEQLNYSPSFEPANLVMLIGTTKIAFWDGNFYFCAKMEDLTEDGKALFEIIKKTYGVYPDIVTLLDT